MEMTMLERFCDIIHIIICLLTRWLAGNCHILADFNWYVLPMGIMVDYLDT